MHKSFDGLSLRGKFTAAFIIIVVGGTVGSTAIGSRILTVALLNQARLRVRYGLEVARMVYEERLNGVQSLVALAASGESFLEAVHSKDPSRLSGALARARELNGLDFLSYVDGRTGEVTRAGASGPVPVQHSLKVVAQALADKSLAWTETLDHGQLAFESAELAERARIALAPARHEPTHEPNEVTSGLALFSAVPVRQGNRVVGALYGGMLLNRYPGIADRVKKLVFGGEQYWGRDVGSVSIFMDNVLIATNGSDGVGGRPLGTRAPAEVERVVLREGRSWYDHIFVAGDRYVAAYEPIRNGAGHIIGMLYLGMLEDPLLAVRTNVMIAFLAVALVGALVVLFLTFFVTGNMIRPLEQMVDATKQIAAGDLDLSVNVTSSDEIGHLAVAFNKMVQSLRNMKVELQQGAHTLEEKVRERTEELLAVQSRMVQSEKLASIGRLAAGVAHEINNPLGGILSLAMLALEDDDENPVRGDLEIIVKQTLRCREIVKGLLNFSHQSATQAAARIGVNQIVENTLSLLERQVIFQNIRTVRKLKDGLPQVFIDPGQMQEVVMNIVLNAVDAMEEEGQLTLETDVDTMAEKVVVRITDTGRGIPEEIMPLIFDPFFTTKGVGQGTGLGLAIVHGIVTSAGGHIEVKSSSAGTTFEVSLPIAAEEIPAPSESRVRM